MLKEMRMKKHMTQEQVANVLGITTSYYGMIEIGTRRPTLKLAKRFSEFFQRPIEEIFFDEQTTKRCIKDGDTQRDVAES